MSNQVKIKWLKGDLKGQWSLVDQSRADAEVKAGNAELFNKPKVAKG